MRISVVSLSAVLTCGLLGACSSRDLADMENQWPDLSDIASAPEGAATPQDQDEVIRALREEAERRKSEGYQAPEAVDEAAPEASPEGNGDANNN